MHSIRLLSFKDQFTYSRSLFKEIGALNIYEINILNILCLIFKCKNIKIKKSISAKEFTRSTFMGDNST